MRFISSATLLLALLCASPTLAHFPWLDVNENNYPQLFFGEGLTDREYSLPETIAKAEVWQTDIDAPAKKLVMEELEEEGFYGLEGEHPIEPRGRLSTTVTYGIYHGSKLTYTSQHYASVDSRLWPSTSSEGLPLQAVLSVEDTHLKVAVLEKEQPLANATVTLSNTANAETESKDAAPTTATTNEQGFAKFELTALKEGLNGLMVMQVANDAAGEWEGKPYTTATQILTVTFSHDPEASQVSYALPTFPESISSFGAAVADGWLYVYSGHIGTAHDHSRDNLSQHFRRTKIDGAGSWESLPMQQPLQGLAMVAHGGKLYRVGGLDARNPSGEEEDMHSVASFAVFDPATSEWSELPPLPHPRSSHNAVVIGDTLYVVGGWQLAGEEGSTWRSDALSFDLSNPNAKWTTLGEPAFKRRALAVSHVDGKLAVLCGMTDDADLSSDIFFYDLKTKAWTNGPTFPGEAFYGFGLAAWNEAGTLYAGGMEGTLYRLSEDQQAWIAAAEFQTPRFFHQLVPDGKGRLLAVAGASPEGGHVSTIERITPSDDFTPSESEPDESIEASDKGSDEENHGE